MSSETSLTTRCSDSWRLPSISGSALALYEVVFHAIVLQTFLYLLPTTSRTKQFMLRAVKTMCIGNASGYGQTPNAVPYNGMLDVSIVHHPGMTQLFEGFYLFYVLKKNEFLS